MKESNFPRNSVPFIELLYFLSHKIQKSKAFTGKLVFSPISHWAHHQKLQIESFVCFCQLFFVLFCFLDSTRNTERRIPTQPVPYSRTLSTRVEITAGDCSHLVCVRLWHGCDRRWQPAPRLECQKEKKRKKTVAGICQVKRRRVVVWQPGLKRWWDKHVASV